MYLPEAMLAAFMAAGCSMSGASPVSKVGTDQYELEANCNGKTRSDCTLTSLIYNPPPLYITHPARRHGLGGSH